MSEEIAHHLPGRKRQFCVPQQGCLNLGSVGYVLFDISAKQYKAGLHTSKHQYYVPD